MQSTETILFPDHVPGDILRFSGKTGYKYVQEIGGKVLANMYLQNQLLITFLENRKVQLLITEYAPTGERSFYAFGKIAPNGSTTFEYAVPVIKLPDGTPLKITDIITGHLGGSITGEGIAKGTLVFHGKIDDSTLIATANFKLSCEVKYPANDIFPTPVEGPIQCFWTFELCIV